MKNLLLILFLTTSYYANCADKVFTSKGVKDISITQITDSEIIGGETKIALNSVKKVERDLFDLYRVKTGMILKDGSILNGSILEKKRKDYTFRSNTFGVIKFSSDDLGGLFFDRELMDKYLGARKKSCIVNTAGDILTGKVLWSDAKTSAVLTRKGMKKLNADEIAFTLLVPVEHKDRLILRNGDVLNMNVSYQGEKFSVELFGKKYSLSINSLKKINIKN